MAMGSLSEADDDFNPEINTTPLVDVMLVLLIIFIITIPVINQSVKIDLPRATNQRNEIKPDNIKLSIDAQGLMYWNTEIIDATQMNARIAEASKKIPQPELHIRAERTTQYEKIVEIMTAAQTGGLSKIGFITDPKNK